MINKTVFGWRMRDAASQHQKKLTRLQNLVYRSSSSNVSPPLILSDQPHSFGYAEAIIGAIHHPIIILDKTLTIRSANKAFYKTFKMPKKMVLGQDLYKAQEANMQLDEFIERLNVLTKENTSFEEFEMVLTFPTIGDRHLLLNAKSITFRRSTTDFILVEIEDITKRKMIDQQKDDFIGYVTHELKTPITTISAFIQILQGYHAKTGDNKSQFLLGKVANQMKRLTSLLNSFANVYKVQTGRLELQKKKFDLDKLVHEVVEAFQYTTSTHNLIIKGSISKKVFADQARIHEVLINLIINAIKYSPDANKVIITLSEKETEAIVSVRDFGFGISKDEQKKVFERFFRVQGKTENKIEGLGLGLYLVSQIIKQHKGKIWVKSNFGEGSTFSISLPLK